MSGDKLGLDVGRAAGRAMFTLVAGVETLNSKVTGWAGGWTGVGPR